MSTTPQTPSFVYFGTPRFARIVLDALHDRGLVPSLIVTLPDAPQGRHLVLTPSEVRVWGEAHSIPVQTPQKLDDAFVASLKKSSYDFFVVAAYGKIIPESLLALPTHGTLNVHPSLLPLFRGASPIESAILSEETSTGVSIMILDKELDHGPILLQEKITVPSWPPKGSVLTDLLAQKGGSLLADAMIARKGGSKEEQEQDHSRATFTSKIKKSDGEVDPVNAPLLAWKKFCAFDEWPGTFFFATKKNGSKIRVVIKDASYTDGAFTILRVIPEGKKEMPYQDFLRGL